MGKNNRYGARRRDGKPRGHGKQWGDHRDRDGGPQIPYTSIEEKDKKNAAFEEYYKSQPVVPANEYDDFIAALKRDLPVSWRFIGYGRTVESLHKVFTSRFLENNEVTSSQLQSLTWYPGGMGYQLPVSKRALRSSDTLRPLHNFLITETELGHVSRQEAVSMIPTLLLDVLPDHNVLDLCAAPGSKTAQLIEAVHATDHAVPSGCVVANDVDNARCYLLVKQALRRHPSSCALITNMDATVMPKLIAGHDNNGNAQYMMFDRVLADVICSGDGTFRKSPDMWLKWNPMMGNGLHRLQFNIARRGLQLLAVNGLMVYSTCSCNPVEDEAVVASLIRNSGGTVELVDVSDKLTDLKRNPGISTWKVMDRDGTWYESFELVPKEKQMKLHESLFPPNAEEAAQFHLDRCLRILPHTQDTGGFFVAVLRKTALLPSQSAKDAIAEGGDGEQPVADTSDAMRSLKLCSEPPKKRGRAIQGFKEEPFSYFTGNDDERWTDMSTHYEISSDFAVDQMLCRAEGKIMSRNIYWTNKRVTNLLKHNQDRVKIINAGVRVFGRVESKYDACRFRLAQEGANILVPHMGTRVLKVSQDDMKAVLLAERNAALTTLQCNDDIAKYTEGCVVLSTTVEGSELLLCTWKGRYTLAPYADKDTRIHMLRLLGHDTQALEFEMMEHRKQGNRHKQPDAVNGNGEKTEQVPDAGDDMLANNDNKEVNDQTELTN